MFCGVFAILLILKVTKMGVPKKGTYSLCQNREILNTHCGKISLSYKVLFLQSAKINIQSGKNKILFLPLRVFWKNLFLAFLILAL